jgi:hypothetical protein
MTSMTSMASLYRVLGPQRATSRIRLGAGHDMPTAQNFCAVGYHASRAGWDLAEVVLDAARDGDQQLGGLGWRRSLATRALGAGVSGQPGEFPVEALRIRRWHVRSRG